MGCLKNLDAWSGGGWGVFIAPTTNSTVGEAVYRWAHWTVRCATSQCPVRQPRHPTVRVRPLELLTCGPPDRSCSLSGAPSDACSDSARAVDTVHCSHCRRPLAWVAVAPLGTLSHPVFRRQTECEPCTCQDQLFTYTAVT